MFHLLSSLSSLSSLHSSTFQSQNPTSPSLAPLLPRSSSHISSPLKLSIHIVSISNLRLCHNFRYLRLYLSHFFFRHLYLQFRPHGWKLFPTSSLSLPPMYSISTLNIFFTFISKFTLVISNYNFTPYIYQPTQLPL